MAIKQYDKIVAQEINNSASTSFSQGAIIKASDIASLYGGVDTIEIGKLIKAEHFQNLGLAGTFTIGEKTYNSFKEASNDENSGLEYILDSNGWALYITKSGIINFTNFSKYGNIVDIFMIGGGGAGNKDGLSGSGGFYVNDTKELVANNPYNLTISSGGTSSGAHGSGYIDDENITHGDPTSGFDLSARGGCGGKAHDFKYYYAQAAMIPYSGSNLYYYSRDRGVDNGILIVSTDDHTNMGGPHSDYIKCDINGNLIWSEARSTSGQEMSGIFYHAAEGGYYQAGGTSSVGAVLKKIIDTERPTNEATSTTIFDTAIIVGGPGSDTSTESGSHPGQGGGALGQYGGASFGAGANGLIAIRNHR